MPTNRGLCFVIADGEHARFVTADSHNVLRTERSFDSAGAHLASHDIGSDRPGRVQESAAAAHHGVQPRHDLHKMEKTKFACFVADEVGAAAGQGTYDRLVLVAPAHCLSDIEEALDLRTAGMVKGRLAKDLVKTPDHELWSHLREWIDAPQRVS